MRPSTGLLAYATWRPAVCGDCRLRQGTAAQRVRRYEVSHHPWDPMAPPEVGPRRSPGLSGPEEVRRGQVQSCSPALRGALPLVPVGQEAGDKAEEMRPGGLGGILHTLDPYGPS